MGTGSVAVCNENLQFFVTGESVIKALLTLSASKCSLTSVNGKSRDRTAAYDNQVTIANNPYNFINYCFTREIGLEVSADKTKYMVMSRDQNAGRIQSVRVDNSTFERVEDFKYLGTT